LGCPIASAELALSLSKGVSLSPRSGHHVSRQAACRQDFGDPRLGGGDVIPAPAFAEPALSLSKGVNLSPHSTCLANFAHSHPQVLPLRLRLGASRYGLALRRDECGSRCRAWGYHSRRSLLRGPDAVPAPASSGASLSPRTR